MWASECAISARRNSHIQAPMPSRARVLLRCAKHSMQSRLRLDHTIVLFCHCCFAALRGEVIHWSPILRSLCLFASPGESEEQPILKFNREGTAKVLLIDSHQEKIHSILFNCESPPNTTTSKNFVQHKKSNSPVRKSPYSYL